MKHILAAILLVLALTGPARATTDWTIRADGRTLTKIVWTGTRYVAIGGGSALLTSEDGLQWTSRTGVLLNRTMVDIAWSGKALMAVSSAGDLAYSSDGIDWIVSSPHKWMSVSSLSWTGSAFLLITSNADSVYTISEQGTRTSNPTGLPSLRIQSRAFSDGRQAVMFWNNGKDSLSVTTDGRTWRHLPAGSTKKVQSILRLDSIYVGCISDTLVESRDLMNWSPRGPMIDEAGRRFFPDTLVHAYGGFWSSGDANRLIHFSPDGLRWKVDSGIVGWLLTQSMHRTDKGLFLLGNNGVILGKKDSASPWSLQRLGMGSSLEAVIWDGTKIVAKGNYSSHLESRDGKDWTVLSGQGFQGPYGPTGWSAMIWSGSKLVNVSVNFWLHRLGDSLRPINSGFVDGSWGENTFIQVGNNGSVATSLDGKYWTEESLPWTAALSGGIIANGLRVVVGDTLIATSPDGRTWTRRATPEIPELRSVAWGNGTWVAVGLAKIYTSKDASTWTPLSLTYPTPLKTIRFLDGRFVAVGYSGLVMTSTDGSNWSPASVGADVHLDDVTWTGSALVAVGGYGTIFTYGDPVVPTVSAISGSERNRFEFSLRGHTLAVPPWVRKVDFIAPDGSRHSTVTGIDGRVAFGALPAGLWIARCLGEGRTSHLRILR